MAWQSGPLLQPPQCPGLGLNSLSNLYSPRQYIILLGRATKMRKNTDKLPPLKSHLKKKMKIDTEAQSQLEDLTRSNTEPLGEMLNLRKDSSNDSLRRKNNDHLQDYKSRILYRSNDGRSHKQSPTHDRSLLQSFQLIQYRKSIKKLINIFEEQTTQLKKLNEHCYRMPSPKRKELSMFNDCIIREAEVAKRHRSKLLQFKMKLKRSLPRTEADESPKGRRRNQTDLRRVLCIKAPYYEEKPTPAHEHHRSPIVAYPQVPHNRYEADLMPFKRQLKEICNRSKRTTLGGWNFDKNETNYIF